ncbi:MAG: hypothetical protein ABEN55_15980 [Bradymonadaceae bacterium]
MWSSIKDKLAHEQQSGPSEPDVAADGESPFELTDETVPVERTEANAEWLEALTEVILGVGGALLVYYGSIPGGFLFDAQWHAIFVGFVLTMIFAHAPVVLRAIARRRIAYHPALYVAPVVLHLSLAVRLYGDWAASPYWRLAGGLGNAAAIATFALVAILRLRRAS